MIKLFLHWWCSSIETDRNKQFYEKMSLSWKNILIIPFAQEKEKWNTNILKEKMDTYRIDSYPKLKIASENKLLLILQILMYDTIFIPWWDYCLLMDYISYLKYFKKIFSKKNIYWISAWANIFCTSSFSDDYHRVFKWLDVLNYSCKCHYNPIKDDRKISILKQALTENEKIIKIKEKDFIELIA